MAIKKIMKPFSTPVLSKRTYRELKLLKHIQHENVRPFLLLHPIAIHIPRRSLALAMFSSRPLRTCQFASFQLCVPPSHLRSSYFVTELLGTDLHRLLTSRPLEKQFIQYFLYQILVGTIPSNPSLLSSNISFPQRGLKYVHSAGVVHRHLVSPILSILPHHAQTKTNRNPLIYL